MNLDNAVSRARSVSGDKSAARLYNDIEQELSLGDYTEEQADEGEQALSVLEERYPGVRQAARDVTDPPAVSRSAGQNLRAGDSSPRRGAEHNAQPRDDNASGNSRSSSRSAPRRGSSSGGRSRSTGGRGQTQRVVERAAGVSANDAGDAVISGLRWLLLAGLAYQVLQPRGANAFSGILGGVGKGVSLLVDPVDPLKSKSSSAAALPNAAQYAHTQASQAGPAVSGAAGLIDAPGGRVIQGHPGVGPLTKPGRIRYATGAAGSHIKQPSSPLATFGGF